MNNEDIPDVQRENLKPILDYFYKNFSDYVVFFESIKNESDFSHSIKWDFLLIVIYGSPSVWIEEEGTKCSLNVKSSQGFLMIFPMND